jgi:hypothetical protein
MVRRLLPALLAFVFCLGAGEGMEEIRINDIHLLVPKGTRVIKGEAGSQVIFEENRFGEAAREISRLEKRIAAVEADIKSLQDRLRRIKLARRGQ